MPNPLYALDAALLYHVFAPVVSYAGRRWGSTAGSLTRAVAPAHVAAMVLNQYINWTILGRNSLSVVPLMILLSIYMAWYFIHTSHRADAHPNPYEHEHPLLRLVYPAWGYGAMFLFKDDTPLIAYLSWAAVQLPIFLAVYLRACPNPPPREAPVVSRVPKPYTKERKYGYNIS